MKEIRMAQLDLAIEEAECFLVRAKMAREVIFDFDMVPIPADLADTKRAAVDLSRALAPFRHSATRGGADNEE